MYIQFILCLVVELLSLRIVFDVIVDNAEDVPIVSTSWFHGFDNVRKTSSTETCYKINQSEIQR
jgi:hypothetical protein